MTTLELAKRLMTMGALTLGALAFAGSACEKQTRTDPSTGNQTTQTTQTAAQTATQDETHEAKDADDVGPTAPTVFMLGGLKGYTEPCGCTLDITLGGIDRIVQYAKDAAAFAPSSVLVDAGDLFFEYAKYDEKQLPQERARVDLVARALRDLKPAFTVPGERDFALGADFYVKALENASVAAYAANMSINGKALPATLLKDLSGTKVLFVTAVDPDLFKDTLGVEVTDPDKAIAAALKSAEASDVQILIAHGDLAFVKARLAANPDLDFGQVGHNPRETDQVDPVGNAHTLEPYDQGRYFGILKLYKKDGDDVYVNARTGSKAELENIEKQITHVNESISKLPPATSGNETPLMLNLRKRLKDLENQREAFKNARIEVPEDSSAFLWRSVAMEPGLKQNPDVKAARLAYNKSLKELNLSVEREIPPVAPGEAFYIGTNQCAMCHAPANEFWEKSAHARAWETLEKRDKEFDQTCIGCHVVGYEKPGGSVVGKVEYPATLRASESSPEISWTKDLRDVGCENCHGPGSLHRLAPVDATGKPQHILAGSGVDTCTQCHVPEHSPRFNYENYVRQITGEGHKLKVP